MPGIRVKEGESFESALRRFKKKCEKAGVLADLRRHQHFEKPRERRKRKLNAAKRKNLARRVEAWTRGVISAARRNLGSIAGRGGAAPRLAPCLSGARCGTRA